MGADEAVAEPETRSRAQRLAAWLAAAAALVSLGAALFTALPTGRATAAPLGTPVWEIAAVWLREWAVALGEQGFRLVSGMVALPAVAAWLAMRRGPVRAGLGLAAVATWAVLVLPAVVAGVLRVIAHSPTPWLTVHITTDVLAVAALVAALVALRGRAVPARLDAPGARRLAAAGIVALGLATIATWFLTSVYVPGQIPLPGPLETTGGLAWLAQPWLTLLVLLGLAAVVWRRDSLLVVPAVVVAGVQEVVPALQGAVRTLRLGEPHLFGAPLPEPVTVAGLDVVILVPAVTLAAAAVFLAAAVP